jgi:hypothetical protein
MRLDGQMMHDIGSLRAQALSASKGLPSAARAFSLEAGCGGATAPRSDRDLASALDGRATQRRPVPTGCAAVTDATPPVECGRSPCHPASRRNRGRSFAFRSGSSTTSDPSGEQHRQARMIYSVNDANLPQRKRLTIAEVEMRAVRIAGAEALRTQPGRTSLPVFWSKDPGGRPEIVGNPRRVEADDRSAPQIAFRGAPG